MRDFSHVITNYDKMLCNRVSVYGCGYDSMPCLVDSRRDEKEVNPMTISKSLAKFLYDAYGGDIIEENGVCVGFDFTLSQENEYLNYIIGVQRQKKKQGFMTMNRYDGFVYYRVDCPSEWFKGSGCWK